MEVVRPRLALTLLLACLSVAVFAGASRGAFVWDDQTLLLHNPNLQAPDYWRRVFQTDFLNIGDRTSERDSNHGIFRPFVSLAYGAEIHLFGPDTAGYHLVSLALHAACVLLVLCWLRRRLDGDPNVAVWCSLMGATLFAVHPSRVESVAWISGCTDLWMTLWILIGLTIRDRGPGRTGGLATGLAFAVALFCKEMAVAAPFALAADEWLRGDRRRNSLGWVFAAPAAALVVRLRLMPLGQHGTVEGGLVAAAYRVVATLGGYTRIVVWPWPASVQTGYLASAVTTGPAHYPFPSFCIGLIILAAVAILAWRSWRRPALRPWLGDLAWFVIALGPVLNVLPVSPVYYVAERNLYLPMLGVAALVARLLAWLLARLERRPVVIPVCAVLIVAWSAGSIRHARHFVSSDALWSYEAAQHPDDWVALRALYHTRLSEDRSTEARALAERMLALVPAPEDKAAALEDWLEADLIGAVRGDGSALAPVRSELDAIAAHGTPQGQCGALYATIAEPGRRWLRRSIRFRMTRARAALAVGDFGSAARQLQALVHDDGPVGDALHPLAVALAGAGDLAGLQTLLAGAPPEEAAALQPLTTAGDPRSLAIAASNVGEETAALAVARHALAADSASVPLLQLELDLEMRLRDYPDARASLTRLRAAAPELAPTLDSLRPLLTPPPS